MAISNAERQKRYRERKKIERLAVMPVKVTNWDELMSHLRKNYKKELK